MGTIAPTDQRALAELGERLARHRLDRNMTQGQLAREAGISKRTLVRLESGESSQLNNLVRVLRALDLLGNLEALVPALPASPIEQLKYGRKERRRAVPRASAPAPKAGPFRPVAKTTALQPKPHNPGSAKDVPGNRPKRWTWGDERPGRGRAGADGGRP